MNTDIRDRSLDRSRRQTRGASTGHLATTNSASKTRPFPRAGIWTAVLAIGAAIFILLALQMLPSGTPPLHAQGSSNSAPVFGSSEYAFTVSEGASVGSAVGTVSASDADAGDSLTYTIESGNVGTVFSMTASTGAITVGSLLDYEMKRRYDLTVQVVDGNTGTATAAVSVEVTNVLDVCSDPTAGAVTNQGTNTGLVGDCEVLLVAKDTLRGTGSLNWSKDTAIRSWDGVTVSSTTNRVTGLDLSSRSLTGSIPWELGSLGELTVLDLSGNSLTGSIPPELGSLSKLTSLRLILSWVR